MSMMSVSAHAMTIRSLGKLHRLSSIADRLIDDRVGVVRYVKELPKDAGAPDLFHYYAQACNTRAFTAQANFSDAGGASSERGMAVAKAIGEAVERYCSAIYDREDLPLFSFESAPFKCVPPHEFALYGEEQYESEKFPFARFESHTTLRWSPTINLTTGETLYVPASMIFMPYFFDQEHGEAAIAQRISTGLACHCSFEEAATAAICEVIERDSFTIAWQASLGRPLLNIESLNDQNQDLVARFERIGSSVTLLNLTTDSGVPTVLSVLHSTSEESPALVFAASADPDPERAVRKSLEELAHTRRLAQQLKNNEPQFAPSPDYANVVTQDDHVHLYTNHANVHLAKFLFYSQDRIDIRDIPNLATGDPKQDLKVIVEKIHAIHHKVLVADLTTMDVQELGLRVVRAVIPGFHPLFMGHHLRALGGSRLWEVPQKLGYQGITRESGDNPVPHPYP